MAQHTAAVEDGRSSTTAVQRPAAAPVWLAPERFEAADFSPDVCVADLRRYVSLKCSFEPQLTPSKIWPTTNRKLVAADLIINCSRSRCLLSRQSCKRICYT